MKNKELPEDLYSQIHEKMPIFCVDIVVTDGYKILLICRDREPEFGTWWFPGGRLLKGESLRNAAKRLVKQETNLQLSTLFYVGIAETQFDEDPFGHGRGTHTVNAVYVGRVRETSVLSLMLDDNHSGHRWVDIEEIYQNDFHPYVKRYVALSEGVIKS